jgi:hypothetical protein
MERFYGIDKIKSTNFDFLIFFIIQILNFFFFLMKIFLNCILKLILKIQFYQKLNEKIYGYIKCIYKINRNICIWK